MSFDEVFEEFVASEGQGGTDLSSLLGTPRNSVEVMEVLSQSADGEAASMAAMTAAYEGPNGPVRRQQAAIRPAPRAQWRRVDHANDHSTERRGGDRRRKDRRQD